MTSDIKIQLLKQRENGKRTNVGGKITKIKSVEYKCCSYLPM